uniref:Large T antigen n=1 Tax=sonrod polyomavirus 1 TaxID=3040504 RepID=A0AA49IX47_9POLY|nr:large T antigen [sonrod polyomavirus 1]
MDQTLNRDEAQELMGLLGLNMSFWGNLPATRRAYLAKAKQLHPDKGGNVIEMQRLNELYLKLEETVKTVHSNSQREAWTWNFSQVPTYGTPEWDIWWREINKDWDDIDLTCNEDMPESPGPPSSSKRPAEEEASQHTPPKKKATYSDYTGALPGDLDKYCSQAVLSNRTHTVFVIHTTAEKGPVIYKRTMSKYKATFGSIHHHPPSLTAIIFIITPTKHRAQALLNFCKSLCTVSFVIVKAVTNVYMAYACLKDPPFETGTESIPGGLSREDFFAEQGEEKAQVNWQQVTAYATAVGVEDVLLLMGMYIGFAADTQGCKMCDDKALPAHYRHHADHYANAQLFVDCKNQKSVCQQACDAVSAQKRVDSVYKTRDELLLDRFEHVLDIMHHRLKGTEDMMLYMSGVAWFLTLHENIDDIVVSCLEMLVANIPKQRYWLFQGPINTGKTTLASAIVELCNGVCLNINLPWERIGFELGVAIDKFMVCFEDVKGHGGDRGLPSGSGISNLDNLRDHMDGAVRVNLEKKHVNKRSQIFPPGIVTMNDYHVPPTVMARFDRAYRFESKWYLRRCLERTPQMREFRVLHSPITLMLLLIYSRPISDFNEKLHEKVVTWKQTLDAHVGEEGMLNMRKRIRYGINVFAEEVPPYQESQNSMSLFSTQSPPNTPPSTTPPHDDDDNQPSTTYISFERRNK